MSVAVSTAIPQKLERLQPGKLNVKKDEEEDDEVESEAAKDNGRDRNVRSKGVQQEPKPGFHFSSYIPGFDTPVE